MPNQIITRATVAAAPLTIPDISGRYHSAADVASIYGPKNVLIWADLDNDQSASTVNDRLSSIILRTEAWLDSRLRTSRYTIPFAPTVPLEITEICAILSGARLYEPRSLEDFTSEAGQATKSMVAVKQRRGDDLLRQILAGKIVLDAPAVGTEVPRAFHTIIKLEPDYLEPNATETGTHQEVNFSDL